MAKYVAMCYRVWKQKIENYGKKHTSIFCKVNQMHHVKKIIRKQTEHIVYFKSSYSYNR